MIWRTCLNHNGSYCHPEVRWCEFYADPPVAAFNAIDDFCRACDRAVVVVQEDRCSFCGKSGLRWASRRKVATTGPEAETLYRYTCASCDRDVFSRSPVAVHGPRTAPPPKKVKSRESPARKPR